MTFFRHSLCILILSIVSFAQIPGPVHPFVSGGLNLNSAGYAPLSEHLGAGVAIDIDRLTLKFSGDYDNAHKDNDGTINNAKGRTRALDGIGYFRIRSYGAVAGFRWSETSTTNYTKQSAHPKVGLYKDFSAGKLIVTYLLPGAEHVNRQGCPVLKGQCTNGVQGPGVEFWVPVTSHLTFEPQIQVILFHNTVTSNDPVLTQKQLSQHSVGSFMGFNLRYTF